MSLPKIWSCLFQVFLKSSILCIHKELIALRLVLCLGTHLGDVKDLLQ